MDDSSKKKTDNYESTGIEGQHVACYMMDGQ